MANNLLVQDVLEVYLKDLTDNSVYFFGLTTQGEVSQQISQEMLKGGIGNGTVGVIQSDKEITFKVTTLLHNSDLLAIQSGAILSSSGAITVQKNEVVKAESATELNIEGTPKGTNVVIISQDGTQTAGNYSSGKVTATELNVGEFYTVVYPCEVTGKFISLDSKKFPKNYYVELHTIAYNPETNVVTHDIYWTFNKALPDGNFTNTYEAGQAQGNEINFTAQLPAGATEYGKYLVIPRN